jgi:predicted Zn finger-like uncharacterized protein
MKIVCESCGAKYSIADEKVAGKVFKIRCKKCSAVIVVKGETQASDESTRVYDYGGEAVWHVVVNGEQQGPFAPRQIGELLAEGKIDWEAYVWREGMDGWQPAKDVEPLVTAVMADAEGQQGGGSQADAPEDSAYGSGRVFGGTSDMGADPFAGDDGGLSGVMQGAASANAAGGSADLFAQSSKSPFAGAAADDDSAAAAGGTSGGGTPRAGAEGMTGQRNENSVLFSLSSLQALATGSGSTPSASSAKPGMATAEGSGLIDIRALAGMAQPGSEKANGSSRDKVEDLLSVGAGPAFNPAVFAAPAAVEKKDTSKVMMVGMGLAILLLGGAVAFLAMRPATPTPQGGLVAASDTTAQPPVPAAAQAATAPAADDQAARDQAQAGDDEAADDDTDQGNERRAERAAARDRDDSRSRDRKRRDRAEDEGAEESKRPVAAAPEPPAPRKSSTESSIDDLLGKALGGGSPARGGAKPSTADSNMAATPSRNEVLSAMQDVTPRVKTCGSGGIATAKVKVAGATGRVTGVSVSGQFAGTPAAACVSREVGKARFPKFKQSVFTFSFPFKL